MNFYASHQRPLQRRSYTGRPSRPAEGQLRVIRVAIRYERTTSDVCFAPEAIKLLPPDRSRLQGSTAPTTKSIAARAGHNPDRSLQIALVDAFPPARWRAFGL